LIYRVSYWDATLKKWQATYIAPLQPPILATFLSWGGSAGAGRARPAAAKLQKAKGLSYQFRLEFIVEKPTIIGYLAPGAV